MRDFAAPRRVRNIRALATDSLGVALNWEPVPSDDLAGYRVYRSNTATGNYRPVSEALLSETAWEDPEGKLGSWYHIRAVDASGNESKPSNPACALSPKRP